MTSIGSVFRNTLRYYGFGYLQISKISVRGFWAKYVISIFGAAISLFEA